MDENTQTGNSNAAGNAEGSTNGTKSKPGFIRRAFAGRGAVIALSVVLALVIGFAIGRHVHRRYWCCGRCAFGGQAMMHRGFGRSFGPGFGYCFGRHFGGNRFMGDDQMHGMSQMEMGRPGMGQMGMGRMGMHQGFDPGSRAENMKEMLGLTDQQTSQIKAIFEQQKSRMESAMKSTDSSRGQDWRAARDQIEAQIKAVLTPDQQAKWQQQMADRMGPGR